MRSALPMTTYSNSSRPLAAVAMNPGISITPAKQSFRIGVISRWSSSSSFKLPNAAGVVISSATNLDPNFLRRGSGAPSSSALSQLLGPCRCCEDRRIPSRGTASCNGGVKALLSSSRSSRICGLSSLRWRIWDEDRRDRCHNERLFSFEDKRRLHLVVDFGLKRRRRGNPWVFPGLNHSGDGGGCGDHIVSPKVSVRNFVNSTKVCGLSGKSAGKFGWMELFKPQVMETVAFRFLSEYHHTTPVRADKDSVSPINFFGLGQGKPVAEVVQAGDPVLHEPAAEVAVEEIGSARIERIINDMVATMRNAPGVGLAAPQIGVQLQIIVLEDTKELISYSSPEECEAQERHPFDLLVIINPKLKTKSGSGTAVFFEGCLSVNGYRALVERDLDVEVTGLGRDGLPVHVEARGWKARILQHECDHLAGNLYVDKMVSRTFRTKENLRLPLPSGCPKPGICKHSIKN